MAQFKGLTRSLSEVTGKTHTTPQLGQRHGSVAADKVNLQRYLTLGR